MPAIIGIGGSPTYFIDTYFETSPYNSEFEWTGTAHPQGVGVHNLDHLTHKVFKGNMDTWFRCYGDLFNFKDVQFFDIKANLRDF